MLNKWENFDNSNKTHSNQKHWLEKNGIWQEKNIEDEKK